MDKITLQDLVNAVGGTLLGTYRDLDCVITGAQSDNRLIGKGDVFFAFPGERVDGHRFVAAALEAGAAGAVIAKEPPAPAYLPDRFYLLVPDVIRAYGDLARWYRARLKIPVIGITGSVGKTTTKDMVVSVLSQRYRTTGTAGNFNNNIGLPRTVLSISAHAEAAVIEMGMNHRGEISYLTGIARPTMAVITNIGEAHIGNLGSRENIFRAKCEIFEGLAAQGCAVLNGDDEYLTGLREEPGIRDRYHLVYVGGGKDCDYRATEIDDTLPAELRFTAVTPEGSFPVTVPAVGHHMIYPALTAIAVGASLGLTTAQLQEGIAAYLPAKMRMETLHLPDGVVVYNDTYNANPQSMKAGLMTLSRAGAGAQTGKPDDHSGDGASVRGSEPEVKSGGVRRIAVLGDMFELGEMEERLHREVGAYAATLSIDTLVTVGPAAAKLAAQACACGLPDVRVCADKGEAKEVLRELKGPDTIWLFKASRGMALEELVDEMQG